MGIQIDELTFGYRRDHTVLSGLSTVFPTGASVLLGPNGAGKSTLLGLVADTLRPRTGTINIEGLGNRERAETADGTAAGSHGFRSGAAPSRA